MTQFKNGHRVRCTNVNNAHFGKVGTCIVGNYKYGTLVRPCIDVIYDHLQPMISAQFADSFEIITDKECPNMSLTDLENELVLAASELLEARKRFEKALDAVKKSQ